MTVSSYGASRDFEVSHAFLFSGDFSIYTRVADTSQMSGVRSYYDVELDGAKLLSELFLISSLTVIFTLALSMFCQKGASKP